MQSQASSRLRISGFTSYNGAFRLTFGQSIQYIYYSVPRLKRLKIFLSLLDQVITLTVKNNLVTILGSKPESFETIEAPKKAKYSLAK